jgi:hypothetical protein
MVKELKGYVILEGTRGAPPADVPALVDALVAISHFAAANAAAINSIEINPFLLFPTGKGGVALDAVIVRS